MSDWSEACDPVPARELPFVSQAEAARRRRRAAQRVKGTGKLLSFADSDDLVGHFLEPEFDQMGA